MTIAFRTAAFHYDMEWCIRAVANSSLFKLADQRMEQYYGPTKQTFIIRDKPFAPNGYVWISDEACIVLIGGTRDGATLGAEVTAFGDQTLINRSDGFNAPCYDAARQWFLDLTAGLSPTRQALILCGHSMGAMTCHALNYLIWKRDNAWAGAVLTTGSPRALLDDMPGQYGDSFYRRVMMYPDPIVLIPPRFSEAPIMSAQAAGLRFPCLPADLFRLTIGQPVTPPQLLWQNWIHSPGGMVLSEIGNWYFSEIPPNPGFLNLAATDLLGALNYAEQFAMHDISVYVSAMEIWKDRCVEIVEQDTHGASVGGSTWGDDITVDVDPGVPEIPGDQWPDMPPGNAFPVNQEGFYVLPLEGVPFMGVPNPIVTGTQPDPQGGMMGTLYLRGELVAVYPTRSKARTVARHLNRFLSRLPAANEVSTSGLQAGMDAYLRDAAVGRGVDKKPVRVVS